jgi:hypothetical protein
MQIALQFYITYNSQMKAKEYFSDNVARYQEAFLQKKLEVQKLSWARLVVFIAWMYACKSLYESGGIIFTLSCLTGLAVFVAVVIFFQQMEKRRNFYSILKKINEDELTRMAGDHSTFASGAEFTDRNHPYTQDLDIFGSNSLYQHINRCQLPDSRRVLAGMLSDLGGNPEILKRQEAIKELTTKMDWVQTFQAQLTLDDLGSKGVFSELSGLKKQIGIRVFAYILSISSISLLFFWWLNSLPIAYFLLSILVNMSLLYLYHNKIMKEGLSMSHMFVRIGAYIDGLKSIRNLNPESELLSSEQALCRAALGKIKTLSRLLHALDARANMMYWIFNQVLLLDIHLWFRLSKWLDENASDLKKWMASVHRMEAISSMAVFTYSNESHIFPEFIDDLHFEAKGLGHPLIPSDTRVMNDFSIGHEKLALITGSNMSGKSTFLRTVGLNIVMAWTGLPVCAQQFTVSRFQIYTSMRIEDDLSENTSSFYAELKRLKGLFNTYDKTNIPVMFFLDEILKGTNSKDRHSGAKGIITRLIEKSGYGFISTHDLELADEYEENDQLINYSFNSTLEGGRLKFDYKLSRGKCISTNASELLQIMGLLP